MKVINLKEKLSKFNELWSPKIIGEMNDQKVQLVKIKGEFVWHSHEKEDELFYVLEGELLIHFRDKTKIIKPGEMFIIPHGIEHKTEAKVETHIILIEPIGTPNTGDAVDSEFTAKEEKI